MSLTPPDYSYSLNETPPEALETGPGGKGPEDALRRAATVAMLLVAGLALGVFTFRELLGRGTGYYVIALCLAVILTAVAYYRFELALVMFVVVIWVNFGGTPSLAEGVSSGTGKAIYPVELGAIFLISIWALRGLGQGRLQIVRTPMNVPLVIYLLFSVWTAVNGQLFWDPTLARIDAGLPNDGRTPPQVTVLELALRLLSVGMFWVTAGSLSDPKWLRRISLAMLLPGVLIGLSFLHLLPSLASGWPVLLMLAPACVLWSWLLEGGGASRPALRILAGLGLLIVLYVVFVLDLRWISGWTALFSGLFFVAFLKSRKLFATLICLAALLAFAFQPFLKSNVVHKVQTSGDMDRFSMARASVLYALKFPMGIGPGNYRAYNMYYGGPNMWNTTGYTSAHNTYAQSLSEMGFVGLILTVFWVVTGVVMLAGFYRRCPPGFSRIMILGLTGMWFGLGCAGFLGDYLIPVYYNGGLVTMATTVYGWVGRGIAVAHARQMGLLTTNPAPINRTRAVTAPASQFYPRRLTP